MNVSEILKIEDITEKIIALYDFCCKQENNTDTEKIIISVEDFENDVMNGGFQQYIENKSEAEQRETLIALERIGAKKSKELFEKALEINSSEELDEEFFKYEDGIQNLLVKYAENHINDFNK